jgi:MFS family permease
MVTAILPTMTYQTQSELDRVLNGHQPDESDAEFAPSISSELTITPARNRIASQSAKKSDIHSTSSRLAGFVGLFTGIGALIALVVFLPLPARFQAGGSSRSDAVEYSFYVVGAIALLVAYVCLFGLHNLPGEEHKSLTNVFSSAGGPKEEHSPSSADQAFLSYPKLLARALVLGINDLTVGLAYIGGFVARASSVGISAFIPLFVNSYFISSGRCPTDPDEDLHDPNVIKRECRRAYIVASMLTGVSQLVALLCAPLFGYLASRYTRTNLPLLIAAVSGIAGYIAFGLIKSPDPQSDDGSAGVFVIVALIGISQIGAIVCSLGLLAQGIQTEDELDEGEIENTLNESDGTDATPLLRPVGLRRRPRVSRVRLKGSIAGVYSLAGGAAILILTKVGGALFDQVDRGAPFFIMAGFNAVLLVFGSASAFANIKRSTASVPLLDTDG